ncbi:MAG: radical SAM protein [Coriobacteriales bacterium]|jgi:radical SAM protein with 4Fe4S-binding SPASM domain|nr:radical SAM protein [Coriobacteriales bacterium]
MQYRLNEQLALRGWEDKPFAVQNLKSGQVFSLHEDAFRALQFCNGVMDMDSVLIPGGYRKLTRAFAEQKLVDACAESRPLLPIQEYHSFPCYYIDSAHWSITGACNMSCRHCFLSAPQAKFGELSHDACKSIIRQLGEAGVPTVSLTGGEPLVRGDFLELVDALTEQGIRVAQIYTNGLLVDGALLDALDARGIRPEFSLSFDGVGWHSWLRGTKGAEQRATDAIYLLRSRGFSVAVESAFHRGSIGSMSETLLLLAELGVAHWKVNPVSSSGNWLAEDASLNVSPEELYDAYLELIARYFEEGSPLTMMLGGFFRCSKGSKEYDIPCKKQGSEEDLLCSSTRNTLYIAADGKLLPCMPLSGLPIQDEMPSLCDITLTEALSGSRYSERIQTPVSTLLEHNPACAACEYRTQCGGGCRAAALAANADNDYLGRDPATCAFFKGGYEDRIRGVAEQYA